MICEDVIMLKNTHFKVFKVAWNLLISMPWNSVINHFGKLPHSNRRTIKSWWMVNKVSFHHPKQDGEHRPNAGHTAELNISGAGFAMGLTVSLTNGLVPNAEQGPSRVFCVITGQQSIWRVALDFALKNSLHVDIFLLFLMSGSTCGANSTYKGTQGSALSFP